MHEVPIETLFARFAATGDPEALAAVFDRMAGKLLLVAAHLAGGNAAEDVVQATFVDAIRQRQRWDRTRPLAPWLIGLLGNHVRRARRERVRVPDPARVATKASELPESQAEANECFAAVAAAVDALPRHYRQVLSLRLVHGLELQQIAHSLDVPLGTVKVRLHRGLALLRRALPAGLVASFALLATPSLGLAAARQAVLAEAARATAAVTTTAIVFGGWGMKKLVVGVTIAALAAVGWFTFGPNAGAAPTDAVPRENASIVTAAAPREPDAARPLPPAATAEPAHTAVERAAAPTTGSLAVQAVWVSDGAPVPDLILRAYPMPARASPETRVRAQDAQVISTDAAGTATFASLKPGVWSLMAPGARSQSSPSRVEVRAGEHSEVRLAIEGGVRLRVTVVGSDGAPRRGATVWQRPQQSGTEPFLSLGTTDTGGRLEWRGLRPFELFARAPGTQPSPYCEVPRTTPESTPAEPIDVRLVLGAAGCTLVGTVVDPQRRPAAGARVIIACDDSLTPAEPRSEIVLTADERGRFHCDEVPVGERYVGASLTGFATALSRVQTSLDQPATVALVLRTGVTLAGRVTNADGTPASDVSVSVQPRRATVGFRVTHDGNRQASTDADGRYRITAIPPGEVTARVMVEPMLRRDLDGADGQELTWDPVRDPQRAIRGTVADANDKPLARWQISAYGGASPGMFGRPAVTDAGGNFEVTGLADAPYRVFVLSPAASDHPGPASLVPRAVVNDVRPGAAPLAIRIDADGLASSWIEGTLALPAGVAANASVSLYPKIMRGGGFPVPAERLEPGTTTFRIGPLPGGEYDVLCDVDGRGRLEQRGVRLLADATLRLPPFAFDAQRTRTIVLRHADGRLAAGASVRLESYRKPWQETSPGTYESAPIADGDNTVLVRGRDFAPATFPVTFGGAPKPVELTVRAATPVVVRLTSSVPTDRWIGALRIDVRDSQGAKLVDDMIQLDGGADFRWPIGLSPGTYAMSFDVFGQGKASTTAIVGSEPLQIDVQIAK